jgi:sulfonate dioxygenase
MVTNPVVTTPSAPLIHSIPSGMIATKIATRAQNDDGSALYPDYLPMYDPLEKVKDLGPFEHHDPGHRADSKLTHLLGSAERVMQLSPHVGTEIVGVQLSQLSPSGLDELALMAAQRGALVFRNQDFGEIGLDRQKAIARHFGPLHVHGWAPHPAAGSEEHMVIYDHKDGKC